MTKRILLLSTLLVAIAEQASLFAQALHVGATLSNYHGVQVSCAHLGDGSITLSVTGGTAPYVYLWNTGATTQNLTGLASGTYSVVVKDSATPQHNAGGSWILHEPGPIDPSATPYEYPNGFNVSCFTCYNGSIAVTVGGGTTPYTYSWTDGATTEDRTSLGMGNYQLTVTDVNGCTGTSSSVYLDEPERADWTMTGNTGSNPPTQFIGTSDNKDVVFKAYGTERLRLLSSGGVKLTGMGDGFLRSSGGLVTALPLSETLMPNEVFPFWRTDGNYLTTTVSNDAYLGTRDNNGLSIRTNDTERMLITADGKVGIGTPYPAGDFELRTTGAATSITSTSSSSDPVNQWVVNGLYGYALSVDGDGIGHIMEDYNTPISLLSFKEGRVAIGDVPMETSSYDYGLYVARGILTERVKVAIHDTPQWSDHVFRPNYSLMPLEEVADFIAQNGHLPDVPSAECMVEEGLDVVQTDAMLLQKIEELTLHLVALNKRVSTLEEENAKLRSR